MWMIGCNDAAELNIADSFNGRKLRPLIPRPRPSISTTSTTNQPTNFSGIHGKADLFSQYHHLGASTHVIDQSKRDFNSNTSSSSTPVVSSSRWNPTPEQLRALEELYRRGTRTPSAEQIQNITSQLRRFGKIEGKNVFYWFQNHKARERQKRRRQMESLVEPSMDIEIIERKYSGSGRAGYEAEQAKNWAPSRNCSTLAEESISIHERAARAAVVTESRSLNGWIQFDHHHHHHRGDQTLPLQQRRNLSEENSTWQMDSTSTTTIPSPPLPNQLINTTIRTTCTSTVPASTLVRTMDPKLIKIHEDLNNNNIFMKSYRSDDHHHQNVLPDNYLYSISSTSTVRNIEEEEEEDHENGGYDRSETLPLFPLCSLLNSNHRNGSAKDQSREISSSVSSSTPPHQFFEFLPLKNQQVD